MKISIQGFQIIKSMDFEVKGITMIVGSTNHGKSSIIRALEAALFSGSGEDFINIHANEARVVVHFDATEKLPELNLEWIKTPKNSGKYTINGEYLQKVGRTGPTDIIQQYGIRDLVVRGEKERINFWGQMSPLFLVHSVPSQIFSLVSSVMEEKKLTPVLSSMAGDIKDMRDTLIKREGSIEALNNQVNQLTQEVKILEPILDLKPTILAIRKIRVALERLTVSSNTLSDVNPQILIQETNVGVISGYLDSLPPLSDIENRINAVTSLRSKSEELEELGKSEAEHLMILEMNEPKFNQTDSLIQDMKSKVDRLEGLKSRKIALSSIIDKINGAGLVIKETEDSYNLSVEEVKSYEVEIGVCPTCKRDFDSVHSH